MFSDGYGVLVRSRCCLLVECLFPTYVLDGVVYHYAEG